MTARHFGLTSRSALGGRYERLTGSSRADTRRDSLPPLPSRSVLEPVEFSEPRIHKFEPVERALLGFLTALALVCAVFLLFVET